MMEDAVCRKALAKVVFDRAALDAIKGRLDRLDSGEFVVKELFTPLDNPRSEELLEEYLDDVWSNEDLLQTAVDFLGTLDSDVSVEPSGDYIKVTLGQVPLIEVDVRNRQWTDIRPNEEALIDWGNYFTVEMDRREAQIRKVDALLTEIWYGRGHLRAFLNGRSYKDLHNQGGHSMEEKKVLDIAGKIDRDIATIASLKERLQHLDDGEFIVREIFAPLVFQDEREADQDEYYFDPIEEYLHSLITDSELIGRAAQYLTSLDDAVAFSDSYRASIRLTVGGVPFIVVDVWHHV